MLVGHFAVGFMGKRVAPRVSLGTLTLAAMLPDFLGFLFIIAGLEHWRMVPGARGIYSVELLDVGLSHSLAMDVVWGVAFAALYRWRRSDAAAMWTLFAAVVSHWVLDVISHRPDMPLAPGMARVYGLGLWTSPRWTIALEGGFWLVSLLLYLRATRARSLVGVVAFWPVVVLLTASWLSNISAAAPPSAQSPVTGSIVALVFFGLMVAWAYWMNRVRPAH